MKRVLTGALSALVFFIAPALALADSFEVGNITDQTLHFSLRCSDGNDSWHNFTLGSLDNREYASGDWDYSCDAERYQLRIETTQSDGSKKYTTVNVLPGSSYALVNSSTHNGFIAYDTRWMVAMRNQAQYTVHVGYSCNGGASHGEASVAPGKIGWFYVKGCWSYQVSTSTRSSDGTLTQWSKDVKANNIYRIVWSSGSGAYILQKI